MDKEKRAKILNSVKKIRAASRQVEIEMQLPKEHAKIHKTSKRDKFDKSSNSVKHWNQNEQS